MEHIHANTPDAATLESIDLSFEALSEFLATPDEAEAFEEAKKTKTTDTLRYIDELINRFAIKQSEQLIFESPDFRDWVRNAIEKRLFGGLTGQVEEGSPEQNAFFELIVKIEEMKRSLVQHWAELGEEQTGLQPVTTLELTHLTEAMTIADRIAIAVWQNKETPNQNELITYYEELIASLEGLQGKTDDLHIQELISRKLRYYAAVIKGIKTENYDDADFLLAGQITDQQDSFHIHTIEPGYLKDRTRRAVQISIGIPESSEYGETNVMIEEVRHRMMATFSEHEELSGIPAVKKSLEQLRENRTVVRHVVEGGFPTFKPIGGQVLPNAYQAKLGGTDSTIRVDSITPHSHQMKTFYDKVFGENAYRNTAEKAIGDKKTARAYLAANLVASHEFGHLIGMNEEVEERLGMMKNHVEEWKATVAGLIGNFYIPYLKGEKTMDDIMIGVYTRIMTLIRYTKESEDDRALPYYTKSRMIGAAMEEAGIANSTGIDLNDQSKILRFFEILKNQLIELLKIYDSGSKEDLQRFLDKNLRESSFMTFVAKQIHEN